MQKVGAEESGGEREAKPFRAFSAQKRCKTDENRPQNDERRRVEAAKLSKQRFLAELKEKEARRSEQSPEERMRALVEKSEQLAGFLFARHARTQRKLQSARDEPAKFAN